MLEARRAGHDGFAQRAPSRSEVRLGAAMLTDQSNNPLAFLPNADAAMVQLLSGHLQGFMHATRAMPDAFADLLAHARGDGGDALRAGRHAVAAGSATGR